jgi:hypothetical protein
MCNLILMGIDIGQKREQTAISVVEFEERETDRRTVHHFVVRHLELLPVGTSYPAVAERLSQVTRGIRRKNDQSPYLYVDATGLGQPIIDLLYKETTGIGLITPVYFTHGDQRNQKGIQVKLGKAYLVSRLQMLLQTGRLHLPRTAESERLAEELLNYEIRVDENANDRYAAFRVGAHDELVTALGLAVQQEPVRPGIY